MITISGLAAMLILHVIIVHQEIRKIWNTIEDLEDLIRENITK